MFDSDTNKILGEYKLNEINVAKKYLKKGTKIIYDKIMKLM